MRLWASEYPHRVMKMLFHPTECAVWCAISKQGFIGLIFVEGTITSQQYLQPTAEWGHYSHSGSRECGPILCVQTCSRYKQLKQQLELMTHEVELVRRKLQQTVHHQHQEEVEALTAKIGKLMAIYTIIAFILSIWVVWNHWFYVHWQYSIVQLLNRSGWEVHIEQNIRVSAWCHPCSNRKWLESFWHPWN